MATTQGSPILDEDLQSWYTSLNTIISNYGGGVISQLTVPGDNEKALASHVNNFFNKMTEMKADEYLGSVSSIYPSYSIVNSGTLIQSSTGSILASATTSAYLGQIKCRNKATNSNASNQYGKYSHETCGSGACGSGTCGSGTCGSGDCGSGPCSYRAKGNGCSSSLNRTLNSSDNTYYTRSTKTHGMYNGNGSYSNGKKQNGNKQNGNKQNGNKQNGVNSHETCSSGTCSSGTVVDILNVNKTKG